jgi:transposase InsO family protein
MTGRDVPMSVRRLIVEADPTVLNVAEFCRDHGVSRWFFYDLRRRHRRDGDRALELGSRAAHRVANRTRSDVEDIVARLRKELIDAGLDAGPASIWDRLCALPELAAPSEATVWRILKRRGLITPEPAKAPRRSLQRFVAERANERWQIDATHWTLGEGTEVEIINVIDDCTRVAIASLAVPSCTTSHAFDAITAGAQRWGWPEGVLSDNGAAFQGRPGHDHAGGLAATLAALGIRAGRSRPYHPQTCGKVERFHQTQHRYLAAQPPPDTISELQAQLDTFTDIYNTARPHRALGRRTPAAVWNATSRSGPADRPLDTPTRIYHATTNRGSVWAGRSYRISIGSAHDHQPATIVITGLACHVFINGRLVRHHTIDPTRTNQPLRPRP